jgi:hypothetical protein
VRFHSNAVPQHNDTHRMDNQLDPPTNSRTDSMNWMLTRLLLCSGKRSSGLLWIIHPPITFCTSASVVRSRGSFLNGLLIAIIFRSHISLFLRDQGVYLIHLSKLIRKWFPTIRPYIDCSIK